MLSWKTRVVSCIMSFVLVVGLCPTAAFAATDRGGTGLIAVTPSIETGASASSSDSDFRSHEFVETEGCLALATDGSLWEWGAASEPRKVLDDVVDFSARSRIGSNSVYGDEVRAAVTLDGSLYVWNVDANTFNLNNADPINSPMQAASGVKSIACGWDDSIAFIKQGGSLWTWQASEAMPNKMMDSAVDVSLGDNFGLALGSDGWAYVFGSNKYVLPASSSSDSLAEPVKVVAGVVAISAGCNSAGALKSDGSLWTWGWNGCGQLGNGATEDISTPTKVLDNVAQVSMGGVHSGAVLSDGSLMMWGENSLGELGNGMQDASAVPVKVREGCSRVSANGRIDYGKDIMHYEWSAAVTESGALLAWGQRTNWGIAHNGVQGGSYQMPVKVMDDVRTVSASVTHAAALKNDGSLWLWGNNDHGQLGNGTTRGSYLPKKILDHVVSVALSSGHGSVADDNALRSSYSAAVTDDGSLWVWGSGANGLTSGDNKDDAVVPVKVLDGVADVSADGGAILIRKIDGSLWFLGNGYPGDGSEFGFFAEPVKVMDNVAKAVIGNAGGSFAAITEDGTLYTWGRMGLAGWGEEYQRYPISWAARPRNIMSNVEDVSIGWDCALVLKSDGSEFAIIESKPESASSTNVRVSVPEMIGTGVKEIGARYDYYGSVAESGLLSIWGSDYSCGLFYPWNGSFSSSVTADKAISASENVKEVTFSSSYGSGSGIGAFIKDDDSLWLWGNNGGGLLGLGWADAQNTPLLIAGADGRSILKCSLSVAGSSFTYDGAAKTPAVTVVDGSKTLAKGTHYSVEYSNNVNAGTATVKVTGIGEYAGTKSAQFSIAKATPALSFALSSLTKPLASGAFTNPLTKMTDGTVAFKSSNASVAVVNSSTGLVTPKGAGTTIITASAGEGANYKAGSASFTLTVTPAQSKFAWGKDNWNFHNCVNSNGKPIYFKDGRYLDQINSTYRKRLEDNLNNTEYDIVFTDRYINGRLVQGWINEEWGGSCYGMSALVLLSKNGLLPYSSYRSGAINLNSLKAPKDDMNVSSLVTYYQMLQAKTGIRKEKTDTKKKSNEENINGIISLLDSSSTALVCYRKDWGHAVVAYGYEYGSWTKGGVTYNGRILICDPNRMTARSEDTDIYFNTSSYNWAIPLYSADNMKSSKGAYIEYAGADVGKINEGGFLSGFGSSKSAESIARLDTLSIADDRSVIKVKEESGEYMSQASGAGDIEEDYFFVDAGERKGTPGYNLYDTESAYKVTQDNPDNLALIMRYEDRLMSAGSAAGKSAIFDRDGYVEVSGESADYDLSITSNENNPTDWFSLSVSGSGAGKASLKAVDRGYVLEGDKLDDVKVEAHNRSVSARTGFSTDYPAAYIYEIDENTIGVSVDTDGNGSFETVIADGSTEGASSGVSVGKAVDAINGLPDVSTLLLSDLPVVQAAREAYDSLTDAQKDQFGSSILKRLEEAEAKIAELERAAEAIDISKAIVSGLSSVAYTGKALTPKPVVKIDGKKLSFGTDYSLSYSSNTNAGTAEVVVTGVGDYKGSVTKTFAIRPAPLSSLSLKAASVTYDGGVHRPIVKTVKAGVLSVPSDGYKVTYLRSGKVTTDFRSGGTVIVRVTGKGNFTGSKTATFKVNPKANPMSAKAVAKKVRLPKGRKALVRAATVSGAVKFVKKAQGAVTYARVAKGSSKCLKIGKKTGKVTVAKNTKVGTYKLKVDVKAAGSKNYKAKTQHLTLTVRVKK